MSASSHLPPAVIPSGAGFWNLRGSFKIAGLLDIGTHCSLVRRSNGRYLLLDACALSPAQEDWLDGQTEGGAAIEAILHLHPFHTISVKAAHRRYPDALLYGTARHQRKAAELPWQPLRTDQPELHALFGDDLDFTVPAGVTLIPDNEKLHFSSVLAFHRASKTLHVDDTLTYVRLPRMLRIGGPDMLRFHPTLARVLEPREGAARDFRSWAQGLVTRCKDVENLCAAHTATLLGAAPGVIADRVEQALFQVEPKLRAHEAKYG